MKTIEWEHRLVCALLKGMFNQKPFHSRHNFKWDVQVVFNYIKAHWQDSSILLYKDLTYKLVILMALTSTSRASALHHLDIRCMIRDGENFVLLPINYTKAGEMAKHHQAWSFMSTKMKFVCTRNPWWIYQVIFKLVDWRSKPIIIEFYSTSCWSLKFNCF